MDIDSFPRLFDEEWRKLKEEHMTERLEAHRSNPDPMMKARGFVFEYAVEHLDKSDVAPVFSMNDVYVVWFCYILGGWKALVSTNLPDGMYYEVTYNKERGETYLDAYKKVQNLCIAD